MNVAETLEQAAALIEERGHCRGRMYGPQGQLCVIGAFLAISNGYQPDVWEVTEKAVSDAIGRWNDRTPTTEVLATLRATAAVWRAKNLPVQGVVCAVDNKYSKKGIAIPTEV